VVSVGVYDTEVPGIESRTALILSRQNNLENKSRHVIMYCTSLRKLEACIELNDKIRCLESFIRLLLTNSSLN